ncbi:MAG: hypothetical protein KDD52_04150 [Bdellovibrionales bacterium]|nr:hypothetical protein [Bdellovibrionales bacterium]
MKSFQNIDGLCLILAFCLVLLALLDVAQAKGGWAEIGEDYRQYREKVDSVAKDPGTALKKLVGGQRDKLSNHEKLLNRWKNDPEAEAAEADREESDLETLHAMDFAFSDKREKKLKIRSEISSVEPLVDSLYEGFVFTYKNAAAVDGTCIKGIYYTKLKREDSKIKQLVPSEDSLRLQKYIKQQQQHQGPIAFKGHLLEKNAFFEKAVGKCHSFHIVITQKDLQGLIKRFDTSDVDASEEEILIF